MDKQIQEYINQQLTTFPEYELSSEDSKIIEKEGKAVWIANKLMRSAFRQNKVADNMKQFILQQVEKSISENKPIYLIPCFGGYKHFWNPSSPEVDWAEFFHFRFMMEFVSPILAVYEPGVIVEYESEEIAVSIINNYPEERTETYTKSFNDLINLFRPIMSNNLELRLIRARDMYSADELFKKMEEIFPEKKKKEWENLTKEELEMRIHRTEKNIMWDGKEDLTKLSAEERREKIVDTKIMIDSFYDADFDLRPEYFEGENHIPILFSFCVEYENVGNWMGLQSIKGSMVDFWVGRGVLEDREGKLHPRILSRTQYEEEKDKIKVVDLKNDLTNLKNLGKIEIIQELKNQE